MKNLNKLTKGQREELYISLKNQTSQKTNSEKLVLKELIKEFSNVLNDKFADKVECIEGGLFFRIGDFVKIVNMDKFGDDWRNTWVKVYESSKGEFFKMAYLGGKRTYLRYGYMG